ncbi:transcriptional regulator, GntR family [Rhodobacteraceae bacterium KLH11]|nr:transcriptional regulator, GntR family [Rhodobacteraceae bacterium KLH11]
MSRPDRVFKNAVNLALDRVLSGVALVNKSALARDLGVSRTTIRAVLTHLEHEGIIAPDGTALRAPLPEDYFDASETMDVRHTLEAAFMRKIREQELTPGSRIIEGQMARQFGVSVQTMREFLISLSRFGFVRKDHQRRWVLEGVTRKYALELHEIRVMFETKAVEKVCGLPDGDPFWGGLIRLQQEHEALAAQPDFARLDTKFHRFLNANADNRLIFGFQDAIAMIFNYHYLWPVQDQAGHDLAAARDHLAIIDRILNRDKRGAKDAMQAHLNKTRARFIASF